MSTITGYGLDKSWVMTSAGFVFTMQIGLGLMEIGSIRRKNSRIVWFKILLNTIFAIWWWYIIGFAWAFGNVKGAFLGAEIFYAGDRWDWESESPTINGVTLTGAAGPGYTAQFAHWVWRVAIALVATTIATGMLSERITMKGVAVFNFFFNLIILPFIFAWTFGLGFLADDIGYRDFSGAFVIFGVGAFAGLIGLLFIKPRYNVYGRYPQALQPSVIGHQSEVRYGEAPKSIPATVFGNPTQGNAPIQNVGLPSTTAFTTENIILTRKKADEGAYENYGVTDFGLLVLGALIVFIGFIFFNAGASQALQTALLYTYAEIAAASTLMGAMGSALFTLLFVSIFLRKAPIKDNAALVARAFVAGMVAVAADCQIYRMWEAGLIGILGSWAYLATSYVMAKSRLDDPADFFAMFAAPAIVALVASAFFNYTNGIFFDNPTEGEILIWQFLSMFILIGWTVFVSLICFGLLRLTKTLRVGVKTEIIGYDYIDAGRHLDYPDKDLVTLEKERVK